MNSIEALVCFTDKAAKKFSFYKKVDLPPCLFLGMYLWLTVQSKKNSWERQVFRFVVEGAHFFEEEQSLEVWINSDDTSGEKPIIDACRRSVDWKKDKKDLL